MRLEADLIFAATLRGLTPSAMYEMELWQLASALGLHRVETRAERDSREIVDAKSEYWEETREDRMEHLAGYSERRRRRARERRQEQKAQREGKATE